MSDPVPSLQHPTAAEVVKTARAAEAKAKQAVGQAIQERPAITAAPPTALEDSMKELEAAVSNRMRDTFALEAFKIMLVDYLDKGKAFADIETIGSWSYRFADSAIRGRSRSNRPVTLDRGTLSTTLPTVLGAAIPDIAPALEEVK